MQDRFKFRVWLKDTNKMYNVHSLHIGTNKAIISSRHGNVSIYINKNSILMQCTGLKDKNSKLIYEGDIVKIFHVSGTMQGRYFFDAVKWNDLRCRFDTENYGRIDDDDIYEVIGNIYENPELLKE